jgi:bifunctional DNA-binding transcriptional regulator/antitoxin component of YhaV-PrlF toxin-antitoxin module
VSGRRVQIPAEARRVLGVTQGDVIDTAPFA